MGPRWPRFISDNGQWMAERRPGPVKEVKLKQGEFDLTQLPVHIAGQRDGGPVIGSGLVVSKDPDTGRRNVSFHGTDLAEMYRRAAGYVDRILKAEKPANLPVQAPAKFLLVVNLKSANSLGLKIPELFLLRADEVIE